MAHYAELDGDNIVQRILVISNDWHWRARLKFLKSISDNKWIQTSYNHKRRGHFAAPGDTYNEKLDIFISPQPYKSWELNTKSGYWEAPVPLPEDDTYPYEWNEEERTWQRMQR